jgi:hypothetical protein
MALLSLLLSLKKTMFIIITNKRIPPMMLPIMAARRTTPPSFELTSSGECVSVDADEAATNCGFLVVRKTGITVVPPFASVIVDEPDTGCVPFPTPPIAVVEATVEVGAEVA